MRWIALAALVTVTVTVTGCGGSDDGRLTVYAASSLTGVFEELAPEHRYNFAGSDELATQIREGAKADVYAAASPRYPDELFDEGLVERPQAFATNELVLIVPKQSPGDVHDVRDLLRDGLKVVVGAEGVPVGDYTRTVLERLELTDVLDSVVSEEENVKGVLAKVALGEADAGFVYKTDALAADDEVRTIGLPPQAQPVIRYPIAVVADSARKREARAFVELLRGPEGKRALERAGFGRP